jgi:hypothetical protein
MIRRQPTFGVTFALLAAVCTARADMTPATVLPRVHLSPAALLMLSVAQGRTVLRGNTSKAVARSAKKVFRGTGAYSDIRINDVGKDLDQMRLVPDRPSTTQSETSVAAFGGNIVVGYNDSAALYTASRSMNGYSYSSDNGVTWTDGCGTPSGLDIVNVGDPSVVVNRHGVFYYTSLAMDYTGTDGARGVIGVSKSTDGGRTFGYPVAVNPNVPPLQSTPGWGGEVTQHLSDKELAAVDNSGGSRDGTVYVAWNDYSATTLSGAYTKTSSQILMSHSSDGGLTWAAPVAVSSAQTQVTYSSQSSGTFVSGPCLAVGPHGEVYCAWEENNVGGTSSVERFSRSDDGGITFALSESLAAQIWDIGNPSDNVVSGGPRVNEFPSLAVDSRTGAVYLAYASAPTSFPGDITDQSTIDRSDVYLIRSTNRGQTWAGPVRMNDDSTSNDQFFPVVAVSDSGAVGAVWYDRRIDPYNQRFDVYSAQSHDGGRTFSANQRVTSVSSPLPQTSPNFDPNIAANYMGDYIGIAASGDRFLAAWGDNRDLLNSTSYGPRPDPNVYFSPITIAAR